MIRQLDGLHLYNSMDITNSFDNKKRLKTNLPALFLLRPTTIVQQYIPRRNSYTQVTYKMFIWTKLIRLQQWADWVHIAAVQKYVVITEVIHHCAMHTVLYIPSIHHTVPSASTSHGHSSAASVDNCTSNTHAFAISITITTVSYTHLTLPTKRIV